MIIKSDNLFQKRLAEGFQEGDTLVFPNQLALRYTRSSGGIKVFNTLRVNPSRVVTSIDLHGFLAEVDNHDPMKVMVNIIKSECMLRSNEDSGEIGVNGNNTLCVSMLFNLRSTSLNAKVKIEKKEDRTLFITPEITLEVIGSPKYEIS